MHNRIIILITLLAAILTGFAPTAYGGNENMKEIYHIDDKLPRINGVEYPVPQRIDTIFAVPEKNAIGTNALNNAITLIRFDNGKLKYDVVRKNFLEYVSGGKMVFMSEFSKDTIGYSQTRGFLLFNIKNGDFKDFIIGKLLEIDIDDVVAINAEKNIFLFQLNYSLGAMRDIKALKLIDLSKDNPIELSSYKIKEPPLWTELGKTTFYFTENDGKRTLHALDENLKPVHHPLLNIYNTEVNELRNIFLPMLHPNLPIAIFSEDDPKSSEKLITWVAVWSSDPDKPEMFKLFGDNWFGYSQFSPDGKWLLFQDSTIRENMLFLMPVIPELPNFLGKPIILECKEVMPEGKLNGDMAWISDPLSVVMTFKNSGNDTGEGKLIKWDLSDAKIYLNQE